MRRSVLALAVVAVLALGVLGAWSVFASPAPPPVETEPITVGTMLYEYSGLVFVADDQGLFPANGLNATLRGYVSSVASIKGVERNETEIALVPEYSVVTEAFENEPITVIGTIDKYQSVSLICRKDRGIANASDLKGKRIGLSRGTIGEFYLGRYLSLKGIGTEEVTLVNLPTTQYVDAITNGSVDAVVGVYTYLDQSRARLGDNLVALPIQSEQQGYLVLVCRNDWAAGHPGAIARVLRAMDQAEGFTRAHPAGARAIVRDRMQYSNATMDAIWPDHQYSLTLDQSLIAAMEDEARWMIANNLTNATAVPNFRKYLDTTALEKIRPDAVRLIG